MHGETVKL